MEIGIIGAGGAGLTAAWLLNDNHNVTIFEKENRLGGHAHTVEVELDGKVVPIDSGFYFFTPAMWPVFSRLLKILGVPVYKYLASATLYTTDNSRVYTMPLIKDGGLNWSIFKPHQLSTMLQFQQALNCAKPIVESANTTITLEQFVESLKLSRSFKDNFFYPLLLAGWCMEMDEFKQFAAYNMLKYVVRRDTGRFSAFYSTEVVGGVRAYVNALAGASTRAKIGLSASIKRITRPADRYLVEDAGGSVYEFDHLVIATNAKEALALIAQLDGAEAARRELSKIEYVKELIAVHGDRRLMPADERFWSVINIRYDGAHSSNSVWKRRAAETPIFKSWVTYETRAPEPLYNLTTYYHPKPTLRYFEAQPALGALQGQNNLWFAGMYTHDVDNHESAILSAVKIAQRLDPRSANLNRLMAEEITES
jgi:predicted NAD/FAD-binding protein